jgi:hypothetical protein
MRACRRSLHIAHADIPVGHQVHPSGKRVSRLSDKSQSPRPAG